MQYRSQTKDPAHWSGSETSAHMKSRALTSGSYLCESHIMSHLHYIAASDIMELTYVGPGLRPGGQDKDRL